MMASPALCYYCFECLSASFKDCNPPPLAAVEKLWEEHEQSKEITNRVGELRDEEEDPETEDDGDEEEDSDSQQRNGNGRKKQRPRTIKLPSIKRLQRSLPSDSSSSVTTSSSTTSANSSRSALSNVTSTVTTPLSSNELSSFSPTSTTRYRYKSLEDTSYPLFVTWNTISARSGNKSLRGCIGTFEAQELEYGLKTYALTSAFDDTRFFPIPSTLLPSLSCSLTLLNNFEPCSDALDWDLGTHGLRISFTHRNRRYGSTYLPDVAIEQGWTKEETLESLMRKAGWDGHRSNGGAGRSIARRFLRGGGSTSSSSSSFSGDNSATESSSGTDVAQTPKPWDEVCDFKAIRYQGLQAHASYAEWQEWRKWAASLDDGDERKRLLND